MKWYLPEFMELIGIHDNDNNRVEIHLNNGQSATPRCLGICYDPSDKNHGRNDLTSSRVIVFHT